VHLPNELKRGTRRTGDLIDFDSSTPDVKVTLELSDQGIGLEVPWSGHDDHYASWFLRDVLQGTGLAAKTVPKLLLFNDSHGSVLLVNCWPRGFHTNYFTGTGKVWASHAVLGVNREIDFLKVNGLRSEVSGLREWLQVRSISNDFDISTRALNVVAKAASSIEISPNLSFTPMWLEERPDGMESILIRDFVTCQSRSTKPLPWDELIEQHHGVRDLLVFARWRRETCTVTHVTRDDDPLMTLDGAEHGEQWRAVVSARDEAPPSPTHGSVHELFGYVEIGGAVGVQRWLELREEFARALDPIVTDRYFKNVPAVTHLAQVGPALEALGYLLFKNRDGRTKNVAKATSLQSRLDRIVAAVDGALPFDGPEWAKGMTRAYNAIKHANRVLPSELDLVNRWQESTVVVRAWVAVELGIQPAVVKRRLELDPSAGKFTSR